MKRLVLTAVFCIIHFFAKAQADTYTIRGKIAFQDEGDIYVYLVTREIFRTPFTGIQTLQLKVDSEKKISNEVSFLFEKVEAGTYGIRCFQDINGNGRLDRGLGGPAEPWGMSWQSEKPKKWPRFSHIAFEVNNDIHNLHIELQQ